MYWHALRTNLEIASVLVPVDGKITLDLSRIFRYSTINTVQKNENFSHSFWHPISHYGFYYLEL